MRKKRSDTTPRVCAWCGCELMNQQSHVKFHNAACRAKFFRWQHRLARAGLDAWGNAHTIASYMSHPSSEGRARNMLKELGQQIEIWLSSGLQMPLPGVGVGVDNEQHG